jgi:hypothetical protein
MAISVGLHTMLGDLDATLRTLYERELAGHGLPDTQVVFEAPSTEWAGEVARPALDLYLYDLQESPSERRVEWDEARLEGRVVERPPPVLIEAGYVVTAWAANAEEEHGLLSAALAIAYAFPVLPDDVRTGALADGWTVEEPPRTRVAQPSDALRSGFWTAVGGRHKASIDLVVEVWCRAGPDVDQAPPVRTQTLRLGMRDRPAAGVEELHRLGGTVTGKDGSPAAGAWIVVPDGVGFAVSDTAGRFGLGSVRAGRHRLLVRGADGAEADISVDVPGPPADVRLK